MASNIIQHFFNARQHGRKLLAVLIDPDTPDPRELDELTHHVNEAGADLIFLGGSLLSKDTLESCVRRLKETTSVPVILFPGSALQISDQADAMLFLSLISGRNPELLIGTHVIAAPYIRQAGIEVMPTGYMLVDSGKPTTASYMSNSQPIPHNKPDIAACTAMAGEMLGLKLMYLDGGSGAEQPVSEAMVSRVRQSVDAPIIVGGGIRSAEKARQLAQAGADVIVIGNATEKNPGLINEIAQALRHEEPGSNFSRNQHVPAEG